MPHTVPLLSVLSVMILAAACRSEPKVAPPQVDSVALFEAELEGPLACADPYTESSPATRMVFSDVVQDTEGDGDLYGLEVVFQDSAGVWVGHYRQADGEFLPWRRIEDLSLNPRTRRISFVLPAEPDTSRFTGTISCMRLNGELRAFQATLGAETMLPRVRHLWDEPN
jgi:hypothetical protein